LTDNKLVKSLEFLKSLFKYALPAFITTFIYSLMTASDIFFLTLFKGVVEVGIYNIIVPIASIGIIFLAPIHNVLLPLTSYLMEGERDKLGEVMEQVYKIVPFIGVYFALFIILFPSAIITFIFGEKWLYLAGFPLSLLTVGYVFLLLGNLLGTIALGLGRIKERLNILFAVGVLNIIMDAFFIWKFGIVGSVIMDSFIAVVLVVVFTSMIKKYVSFKISYSYYFRLCGFSILCYLLIRFINIKPVNLMELLIYGVVYSLVFLMFGYLQGIYNKKSLSLLLPRKQA
jgi:O-antigen/teichoic acid export membrane protein